MFNRGLDLHDPMDAPGHAPPDRLFQDPNIAIPVPNGFVAPQNPYAIDMDDIPMVDYPFENGNIDFIPAGGDHDEAQKRHRRRTASARAGPTARRSTSSARKRSKK
eukprot:jgi/Mesvir1/13604/Mv05133-RA.1